MNDQPFYTLQPEWTHPSVEVHTTLIEPLQNENIQSIYYFRSTSDDPCQLTGIPDGCLDLIFNLCGDQRDCFVIMSPAFRRLFFFRAHTPYVGVRLKPFHDVSLFEVPFKELNASPMLPLFDVAPRFLSLYEKLLNVNTRDAQQQLILTSPFLQPFHHTSHTRETMQQALFLIQHDATTTPQKLSEQLCYSERHIRNLFNTHTGFSPKCFIQIMKLQTVLHQMTNTQFSTKALLDEAYFYDDAHFYKMFKKYIQMTPKQYVEMLRAH